MFPRLKHIRAIKPYTIWVAYENGVAGELDLSALAGKGIFSMWDERELFMRPFISETGAIAWNDMLDICPDNAYLKLTGISFSTINRHSEEYAPD